MRCSGALRVHGPQPCPRSSPTPLEQATLPAGLSLNWKRGSFAWTAVAAMGQRGRKQGECVRLQGSRTGWGLTLGLAFGRGTGKMVQEMHSTDNFFGGGERGDDSIASRTGRGAMHATEQGNGTCRAAVNQCMWWALRSMPILGCKRVAGSVAMEVPARLVEWCWRLPGEGGHCPPPGGSGRTRGWHPERNRP